MNIRFYETFILLAKLGNFSKTAELSNATQPTINGRISALEDSLGVRLYVKGSKPLQLTPQGKMVLQYAKMIVELENKLKASLSKKEFTGALKIGAIEIVTMAWLPNFIRRIQAEYPGLAMEVSTGTVAELVPRLKKDEFDLVFVLDTQNDFDLFSKPLCTLAMWWVANPHYYPVTEELDIVELSNFPIVLTTPKTSTYPYIRQYFAVHNMQDILLDTQLVKIDCVASVPTAVSIVKSGLGIMPAPAALVSQDMRNDNTLARLPVRQELPNVCVTACLKNTHRTAFLDEIVAVAESCAKDFARSAPDGTAWA